MILRKAAKAGSTIDASKPATPWVQCPGDRIYTTAYTPTAADVGYALANLARRGVSEVLLWGEPSAGLGDAWIAAKWDSVLQALDVADAINRRPSWLLSRRRRGGE